MNLVFTPDPDAVAYLSRDPYVNREMLLTLQYQYVAGMYVARHNERVTGVLLRGPGPLDPKPTIARIEASNAEAVHELIARARLGTSISFAIHRPWIGDLLQQAYNVEPDGTGWYGYLLSRADFDPLPSPDVRLLTPQDAALVERSACGWNRAYFDRLFAEGRRPWAIMRDGQIVCRASSGYPHADSEEVIGVWTHPRWRQRGFGHQIVSAVTGDILSRRQYVAYTTTFDNATSQAIARRIGFRLCATTTNYVFRHPQNHATLNREVSLKQDF